MTRHGLDDVKSASIGSKNEVCKPVDREGEEAMAALDVGERDAVGGVLNRREFGPEGDLRVTADVRYLGELSA